MAYTHPIVKQTRKRAKQDMISIVEVLLLSAHS